MEKIKQDGRQERRWNLGTGTAYGFVFGLSFVLLVWGYDALLLLSSHADQPWGKLLVGLPVCLVVGTLMGFLSALISFGPLSALLGALVGGLLCFFAGHVPYDGLNLLAWLGRDSLWGAEIFPYGPSAELRMWTTVPIGVVLGAAVGYAQHWAVDWAWNGATARGRMGLRSWLALLICLPFVLAMAISIDTLVNAPLRNPQLRTGQTIEKGLSAAPFLEKDISNRSIKPYRDRLVAGYVTYLVSYDVETLFFGTVDAVFDNGLVLRCNVGGEHVLYCEDFGKKSAGWMDDLIHAGRTGERRWLREQMRSLDTEPGVVPWLRDHAAQMAGDYQVERVDQAGGWFRLAARFDGGFVLVCRFHGGVPVVVDLCKEESALR